MDTEKIRWDRAIKAAKKRGVAVRQNVASCCRGCAEPFKKTPHFDEKVTPYTWTFGGQGSAIAWGENGMAYNREQLNKVRGGYSFQRGVGRDRALETEAYFNHGNGGGEILADEMKREGFEVDWDGTENMTVIVRFDRP